jgi:TetR/AcrR family transcriptional regulator, regulator of cefoperazone and chloramphenicol sensitivity
LFWQGRPKVLEKAEKLRDPTRERILDAALDLFGERGLTGATVRDIAARAKVNVAAISYHFGGKEELYRAVAETVVGSIGGRVRSRVGALLAAPPSEPEAAVAALEDFIATMVDVIVGPEEMRRVARFIIREQMQPTATFEIFYKMLSEFHGAATQMMATAAGLDPEADGPRLRVFLMIGQVLFLRIAEAAVLRRLGRERYDAAFMDEAKAMIRQNVRAMVDAARESKS